MRRAAKATTVSTVVAKTQESGNQRSAQFAHRIANPTNIFSLYVLFMGANNTKY
jgi:hypothetical protein